jgi:NAD(P)-dependent dehydrogenase (short-subunit alcohol dehydrogenase family)
MQPHVVITGGNAGLGLQVARFALAEGCEVTLGARSLERGAEAASNLSKEFKDARVNVSQLDLSDLESVQRFASSISRWDVLINNAGAKIERPYKQTAQGFEWHVGVNHLGHFALTALLWPTGSPNAKLVTVSSIVARKGKLEFELAEFDRGSAYANSKFMNLVFAQELARRLDEASSEKTSMVAHPGFARASFYGSRLIRISEYLFAHSARLGAKSIWAATKSSNGDYLAPRWFELWGKPKKFKVKSDDAAEKLWIESEARIGHDFKI